MDPIEEIKKRILELEEHGSKLKELIPWKEKEAPLLQKEIEGIRAELHDLRQQLVALKKHETPPAPVQPAIVQEGKEGGELRGFFQ